MPPDAPPPSIPTIADCTIVPVGYDWDSIRVSHDVGERAVQILGSRSGAVAADNLAYYWFVRLGTAAAWDLDGTRALGINDNLAIPPGRRTAGPGPFWRICPGDGIWATDPQALRAALEDAVAQVPAMATS